MEGSGIEREGQHAREAPIRILKPAVGYFKWICLSARAFTLLVQVVSRFFMQGASRKGGR